MVIHRLGHGCCRRHESEGPGEVGELEGAAEHSEFDSPTRQGGQAMLNFIRAQFGCASHGFISFYESGFRKGQLS
jgi:hypothetical protein